MMIERCTMNIKCKVKVSRTQLNSDIFSNTFQNTHTIPISTECVLIELKNTKLWSNRSTKSLWQIESILPLFCVCFYFIVIKQFACTTFFCFVIAHQLHTKWLVMPSIHTNPMTVSSFFYTFFLELEIFVSAAAFAFYFILTICCNLIWLEIG